MEKTRHSSIPDSSSVGSCERDGFRPEASDGKGWPTPATLTSKNASRPARWALALPRGEAHWLLACLGLALAGCSTGADLDTSYDEYIPTPTTGVRPSTSSSDTSSTTSGDGPCDDSSVNGALENWCSSSSCHGDIDENNARSTFWLFSPTRSTDFLNLPATTQGCEAELLVDTADPEASLLITAIERTSPCGVVMPKGGLEIDKPEEQACIEEWVRSLAASGN